MLHLDLHALIKDVDWIFHQAAQAGVRASWGSEFSRYVDCNVLATQLLLEATLQAGTIQRFIYASSSSVYGDVAVLPVKESVALSPISPYGVTKLAAENLCTLYYRNFGVPTVSLRYFTVYGPRQRPDMAFHRFCKAALEQQPIHIFDDGEQTRDFTYISDVVEANIRSATAEAAIGKVLNIAGGSRVTVKHVLDLLQTISQHPLDVVFEQKQHGDVRDTFADTTLAEQAIDYHPQVSLEEGLTREYTYFSSIYGSTKLAQTR